MKNRFKTITLIKLWFVYHFGVLKISFKFGKVFTHTETVRCADFYNFKHFLSEMKDRILIEKIGREKWLKMTKREILNHKV